MTSPANTRDISQAAIAMSLVGSLTAVSATIASFPVFGGQAVRYAGAAALLFAAARLDDRRRARRGGRPPRPGARPDAQPVARANARSDARPGTRPNARADARPGARPNARTGARPDARPGARAGGGFPSVREFGFLVALAATGLAAFNVCIIFATRDTSPATIGTVVATVPIVLALVGPLLSGRRPAVMTVLAACVVTAGAGLANGFGGGTVQGLLLSLGALGGEICFSLLAVPVLPRLGPIRTSAWSAALASPMLLVTGLITDGRHVLRLPTGAELAGLLYLTVIVTCAAFLLWYDALGRMGADRAGLFAGMIPVSAVLTTMVLGIATPRPAEIAGAALVAVGVVLGLRPTGPPRPLRPLPEPGGPGGRGLREPPAASGEHSEPEGSVTGRTL
ncbi:DMT family transporter [Spirillospora sp. NPDC052269]